MLVIAATMWKRKCVANLEGKGKLVRNRPKIVEDLLLAIKIYAYELA